MIWEEQELTPFQETLSSSINNTFIEPQTLSLPKEFTPNLLPFLSYDSQNIVSCTSVFDNVYAQEEDIGQRVSLLEVEVARLNDVVVAQGQEVTTQGAEIVTLRTDLTALQQEVTTQAGEITQLQGDLLALDDRVKAIELGFPECQIAGRWVKLVTNGRAAEDDGKPSSQLFAYVAQIATSTYGWKLTPWGVGGATSETAASLSFRAFEEGTAPNRFWESKWVA